MKISLHGYRTETKQRITLPFTTKSGEVVTKQHEAWKIKADLKCSKLTPQYSRTH